MHSRRHLPGYAVGLAALAYCGLSNANGLYPNQFFSAFNNPAGMVMADVNGDGKPDIVEVGADATVAVLTHKKHADGFRSPSAYYVAGTDPEALAVGDLNGDGKPDIVVADSIGNQIVVLLGNGDGTFRAQTPSEQAASKGTPAPTFAVGSGPTGLALADVNGDGNLDVIVTNYNDATVEVLLGKGDGTFSTQNVIAVGLGPTFVAVADLNDDGKPDLIVANSADTTIGVLLGKGNGTFQAQTLTQISGPRSNSTLQALVVADFDHDGKLDVVSTTTDPTGQVVVYLSGNGDGTFRAPRSLLSGLVVRYMQAADVDGDGNLDLIMGSFTNGTIRVRFGDGHGNFGKPQDYPASGINSSLTVQAFDIDDVDGDGKPDIVALNASGDFFQVLFNDGHGGFHLPNSYPTGDIPSDIESGDLNGDGHMDVVEIDSADGTLGVRLGNGDGTLQALQTYPVGSHPQRLVLRDLNGDGKIDAVTANNGDGSVSVLLGNGDGTFQAARRFSAGANPVDVAVADMDQDGKLDLVVADAVVNTVSILRGNGDGTFKARHAYTADSQINALAVGDVTRDGFPDVVTLGGNVAVLYNDGTGALIPVVINDDGTSNEVYSAIGVRVMLADLNDNNRLDIVVADYSNSQIVVLRAIGKGIFDPTPLAFPTCTNPNNLAAADLNDDGNLDIIATCVGSSTLGVMLGNGQGGLLGDPYPAEIDPRGVAIADFDEDGQPDLAVVNGGSDRVDIQLEVHGVVAADTAPVAVAAPFSVADGNVAVGGILNATDKDGDPISFGVVMAPVDGVLATSSDGSFTYLAAAGFVGKDSFQFQASDGVKLSNIGTIPITVAKNSAGSTSSKNGFLGGFYLPLLPLLFGAWRRRRRG